MERPAQKRGQGRLAALPGRDYRGRARVWRRVRRRLQRRLQRRAASVPAGRAELRERRAVAGRGCELDDDQGSLSLTQESALPEQFIGAPWMTTGPLLFPTSPKRHCAGWSWVEGLAGGVRNGYHVTCVCARLRTGTRCTFILERSHENARHRGTHPQVGPSMVEIGSCSCCVHGDIRDAERRHARNAAASVR